jgi:DNA-directed RNA polymerase specialized sigma24 family protein
MSRATDFSRPINRHFFDHLTRNNRSATLDRRRIPTMTSKPRSDHYRNGKSVDPADLAETIALWRDVDGYPSAKAIAAKLGCSESAVRRRIRGVIEGGGECFYRTDAKPAAMRWFASAKKGA